jgi:hypothetical protein
MMSLMDRLTSLANLFAQTRFDFWPFFFPTIGAQDIADGQYGIDMCFCPPFVPRARRCETAVHACAFEACFYHQLVAAFHNPATDWSTLCLKKRILQLRFPLFSSKPDCWKSLVYRDVFVVAFQTHSGEHRGLHA